MVDSSNPFPHNPCSVHLPPYGTKALPPVLHPKYHPTNKNAIPVEEVRFSCTPQSTHLSTQGTHATFNGVGCSHHQVIVSPFPHEQRQRTRHREFSSSSLKFNSTISILSSQSSHSLLVVAMQALFKQLMNSFSALMLSVDDCVIFP